MRSAPSSGVRQLGWRESLGSVFLAGSAAGVASWLADRFAPGFAVTPLSTFAVGTVAFVVSLWGITLFLIPGRRPSSMPGRWAATARSVAAGLLIAGIAVGSTWAYLSSIEIDDGLEGLIFFPSWELRASSSRSPRARGRASSVRSSVPWPVSQSLRPCTHGVNRQARRSYPCTRSQCSCSSPSPWSGRRPALLSATFSATHGMSAAAG